MRVELEVVAVVAKVDVEKAVLDGRVAGALAESAATEAALAAECDDTADGAGRTGANASGGGGGAEAAGTMRRERAMSLSSRYAAMGSNGMESS